MAQNHRIAEIKDLSDEMKERLAAGGITTAEDLLARATSPSGRAQLARELGVEAREVTEWVNRADLMRITGVGTEMANLLEEGGVDSCKELQHRVAENLHAKLKEINDERSITQRAPSLTQVTAWIDEAKTLVRGGEADEETASVEKPKGSRAGRSKVAEQTEQPEETASSSSDQEPAAVETSISIRASRTQVAEDVDQPEQTAPSSPDAERQSLAASEATTAASETTPAPARAVISPAAAPTEGPGWIRRTGTTDCPPEFPIKGNGSSRRYHVPGQLSYAATNADFCFADEQAAANRGFRPTGS